MPWSIMMSYFRLGTLAALVAASPLYAQSTGAAKPKAPAPDSGFAAMQDRGKKAMGVDQYTSSHTFDALPTCGRIELVRDTNDSVGVAQIRAHIREIARAFANGDFTTPAFVHMQTVPGTATMREKRALISYEVRDVPRGAELLIRTKDLQALAAIHEFMAFQRGEHHAAGMGGAMKHP
jgi:hypothetical protein